MSLTELTGNPRHDQLLMLIAERGYMNIDELANLLDVSTQTVRRDIRKLSEQGLITRHHGGAGRASSVVNTAFEQREVSQTEEKKAIAEAVADYIPDGSTIFITIGTTVEHVNEANVVKTMMAHARNILLVADHTKYHASAAVEIGNVAQVTALFTDELPPAALKSRLQDSQIEIILPQEDA